MMAIIQRYMEVLPPDKSLGTATVARIGRYCRIDAALCTPPIALYVLTADKISLRKLSFRETSSETV